MNNNTILIGLNELNFDYINYYINKGKLQNFKFLFEKKSLIETESEKEYHLLEPWIQWATIHTGLTYKEHQIFRLGDITKKKHLKQIWEVIEERGGTVGAISPFNAENRLKRPSFFVPDPWTKTHPSGNWLLKKLSDSIQQIVNDNAQSKLTVKSMFSILLGFLVYVSPSKWIQYIKLASQIKKPGTKAIILDKLLGDIFIELWYKNKPTFSSLFLNTGAHIQHHYLFNSIAYDGEFENPIWYCPKGYDPLEKVLSEYDQLIGRLLKLNTKIIIATGLHQKPHKHLTYYWRLKDHEKFINLIGIKNLVSVLPRMSRDFLVEFKDEFSTLEAEKIFLSYRSKKDNKPIFSVDNRGDSLFVELIYSNNIDENLEINSLTNPQISNFSKYVSFVAIKNGEHDGVGYVLTNFKTGIDEKNIPLKRVYSLILDTVLKRDKKVASYT